MNSWIQVAGWTLVHFVWQGAAIAAVAGCGLRLLRAATPNARYTVASAALGAMLVSPVITAHRLSASLPAIVAPGTAPSILSSIVQPSPAPRRDPAASFVRKPDAPAGRREPGPALTILVAVWLTGVALLLLRLAGGWWKVRGLHRTALATTPSHWQMAASRLAALLLVRPVVHIVESVLVDTPTVVGWWRPVVLLPVAALANLTPAQVEAILAHELAHVRRHDYLVNLLQHVAETLLFYHPAVWWLSGRMRDEREQCCDEIVLQVCRDPVGYASALAQLETWRHARAAVAVAATDGSLVERIRRVLAVRPQHQRPLAHAVVTATVVGLLIAMVGGGYRWPLAALGAAGPSAQSSTVPPVSPRGILATVNGEPITEGDLEHYRPLHGEDPGTPLPRVLVELVNERLVAQRGKQLGYIVTDGERQDALAYVRRQNKVQTDAQLQTVLATQQLTISDLQQHLERAIVCVHVRQAEAFDRVEVTDDDARQYFETHLDEFPLQTFDLARTALIARLRTAKLGQDLAPASYLQSLRTSAVLVWARPELEQAYQEGVTQRAPQRGLAADRLSPAFDVASVKRNTSGDWRKSIGPAPGGRFVATNQTLRELMPFAYGVPYAAADIRIVGGPKWIDTDRFDVAAKVEGAWSPQEMGAMLRTLLADRFRLRAHGETKELPIYALVTTKGDGALGPRLRRSEVSEVECEARRAKIRRNEPVPPPPPGARPVCGSGRSIPGNVTARGWSIESLAAALAPSVNRVIVDRTGLAGLFDWDLEWTPDQLPRQPPGAPEQLHIDPNGPSIFTAVQEQLGLKLESAKGPVEVVVIDSVEHPTED